jgi:RNA polymerase sigma factor (sigma-70 family)
MTDRDAQDLAQQARAAASGDRAAAQQVLDAVSDDVYGLSLRMLGHPADAEDAAQEILIIVLTHLSSFRGDSSLRTWVWRIAANHLAHVRRGRRETLSFDTLSERLGSGLRDEATAVPEPEADAMTREVRLRCTEAMLLSLDREHRVAYVLGDIFNLTGEEAAEVLQIDAPSFRKRLSRARSRLYEFMKGWCGEYAPKNPCRCAGQSQAAVERGIIAPEDLYLSKQRSRPTKTVLTRATDEVTDLMRVADVLRGPSAYAAPLTLVQSLRELISSQRFELLRH